MDPWVEEPGPPALTSLTRGSSTEKRAHTMTDEVLQLLHGRHVVGHCRLLKAEEVDRLTGEERFEVMQDRMGEGEGGEECRARTKVWRWLGNIALVQPTSSPSLK